MSEGKRGRLKRGGGSFKGSREKLVFVFFLSLWVAWVLFGGRRILFCFHLGVSARGCVVSSEARLTVGKGR